MTVLTMAQAAPRAASLVGTDTPYDQAGWCQHWCSRVVYNDQGPYYWGGNGRPWAINMWLGAVERGRVVKTSDPSRIPAGAMAFSKGSSSYGHVFIGDGKGGCYSTDYPTKTDIGHSQISRLMSAWGHTLLGYIEVTGAGTDFRSGVAPARSGKTVFDICEWNIARPRWYTPWSGRAAEIARELKDEASVYCFQELFEDYQIATIKAALPKCQQFSGRFGLEFFYDISPDRWTRIAAQNMQSPIPNRWAQKVTLKRISTGQMVDFFNCHAPIKAEGETAKAQYGAWLAGKIRACTNPVVVAGDFNASSDAYSPKKELRSLGYISYKEQAAVVNEGTKEFMTKGQDLADIRTRPAGPADIASGLVDLSTNTLESDHRRIEAQVIIGA